MSDYYISSHMRSVASGIYGGRKVEMSKSILPPLTLNDFGFDIDIQSELQEHHKKVIQAIENAFKQAFKKVGEGFVLIEVESIEPNKMEIFGRTGDGRYHKVTLEIKGGELPWESDPE